MKKVIVTGCAGFIGSYLSKALSENSFEVFGIDNVNDYYDINLKKDRLENFIFKNDILFDNIDISNQSKIKKAFNSFKPDIVINLAAQAGVRYSISNPMQYAVSNLLGFTNILELSKELNVEHFIYASSSSVYGNNENQKFCEDDIINNPESFYAATKISNELISKSYTNLFNLRATGLRFFTVYGPWGRPDMAYFLFTKKILQGEKINVFGEGKLLRDFTYITDIVEAIQRVVNLSDNKYLSSNEIFNIGNENPVILDDFISTLEKIIGRKADINYLPIQKGDVFKTSSDTTKLKKYTGFSPQVKYEEGLRNFFSWYKEYYNA